MLDKNISLIRLDIPVLPKNAATKADLYDLIAKTTKYTKLYH